MRACRFPVLLLLTLCGFVVTGPAASGAGNLPDHCYSNSDDPSSNENVECDSVKLPDLGGVVSALAPGTMLPTRLPSSWTGADVYKPEASLYRGEPKGGIGVQYNKGSTAFGGASSGVTVGAFPGTSVRHVRTGLLRDVRRYVQPRAGDRLLVSAFRAGRFHGTRVTALQGKVPNKGYFFSRRRYYIWESGGLTYVLFAEDNHPHPLTYALAKTIASFRATA